MRRNPLIIEIVTGVAALLFLVYTMRSMLLFHQTTLCHDNVLWFYPLFHFSAVNIINGHYPLWNPFTHGGEPFYPILLLCKMITPIPFLTIYFGKFITTDTDILFVWHYFIQMLTMAFGTYIVLRMFTRHLFVRLTLIPILLYSSFLLVSMRQFGFLSMFIWVPYITYFLHRIVYNKDYRWYNWLFLAVFVGFNWQSYLFVGVWVFILFVSVGFLLFRSDLLKELFKTKGVIPKLLVTTVIILFMMAPNIIVLLEKDKFVFPARMHNVTYLDEKPMYGPQQFEGGLADRVEGINMSYNVISQTGTFSTIWDFIQIISPDGNPYIGMPDRERWGRPSEAYMYLGILPWAIAILGMVAGKHGLKKVWLIILFGFALLILGPPGGLHRLLYYIYPPVWYIRHTHLFVLFFMFPFLYFYVLGLNHIVSAWHNSISGASIRDVIKRPSILLFVAYTVAAVYWITKFEYTQTGYLFLIIFSIVFVGWLLRKNMGKYGLFISLILSQIVLVLVLTANALEFLSYILLVFGIPLFLFLLIKTRRNYPEKVKDCAMIFLAVVFTICLLGDLIFSLIRSGHLYNSQPHPEVYGIQTTATKPLLHQNRFVSPKEIYASGQAMRYTSLAYLKPFVFSPLYPVNGNNGISNSEMTTRPVAGLIRNNSFESWVKMHDGSFLPEHVLYHQDGNEGSIERYSLEAKDGKYSVLLKPSSIGNSFLRFQTKNIDELKGQYIRFSVWVKSQNNTPDAVQVDIQDGIGDPSLESYKNSGNWKRIEVLKYIDENASELFVTCNVKHNATAGAYFDGANIDIVDINQFELALNNKRWSSLLLPRKYFELIHSDISPVAISDMFAVDKPIFQFRYGAIAADDDEAINLLNRLGPKESVQLLEDYVIVDSQINPSNSKLIIPAREYGERGKAVSRTGGEKSRFSFSVNQYDYNNLDMKVSTDKDGFLCWADGYDKWWDAYINGEEVPIYRANINFKAIALPKGENNIRFVYNPVLFKVALLIFYGVSIISIVVALISFSIYYRYGKLFNRVEISEETVTTRF